MSTPKQAQAAVHPRWYAIGGADILFVVLALCVASTARQSMLDDPGLGWHLRNIDAMLTQWGWLHVDSFTQPFTSDPRPWYSNQWLGELPLWLGERWAGREGIAAVMALVIAFTLRCLYRMLLADGLPWPAAVLWTVLAAMGTSCSWTARPNVFTFLFVLLTARMLVLYAEERCSRRFTLWLWPLFAVWANVHGGFVAGLILVALALAAQIVLAGMAPTAVGRRRAGQHGGHLLLLLIGAVLATLVNPYGLSLYHWVFQLLGEPFFMDLHQEWKSPDFHGKGAMRFELFMLLLPAILAGSRRRPHLTETFFVVAWLHLALTGFRYVPLWVLLVVPVLARCSKELRWLPGLLRHLDPSGQALSSFASHPPGSVWLGSVLGAGALLLAARCTEGRYACHRPDIIPEAALDRFLEIHAQWSKEHGRPAVVFHSYDWGGYLTWHGWPAVRNWIDDRNEVQGKDHIEEYFAILETRPGWEEKLERDRVELICIQAESPLTFRLAESKSWRPLYRDAYAVIFERSRPYHSPQPLPGPCVSSIAG